MTTRVRWLGRVAYRDALALQRGLHRTGRDDWLLLLEHPGVYTLGVRVRPEHVLVDPAQLGAELIAVDRGGDVTYHGPGQLVGYPVGEVRMAPGATRRYVRELEQVVIDAVADLGLAGAHRIDGIPGVWVGDAKLCAVGVRLSRGRSMHGFALNVGTDLAMFDHIVPCGLAGRAVTSLATQGIGASMADVVDAVARRYAGLRGPAERQDVASMPAGRSALPGALPIDARKPPWLRARARLGPEFVELRSTIRNLDLVTVCEEAGCPNIFECWGEGTATFMINGSRCTRACGFCLVDTRRPAALDAAEPARVAEAVARMGLAHAVVTAVARDDLADGGAGAFVRTVTAIRQRCPATTVEVLIPDCQGREEALSAIFAVRPDVVNHNLETVARLQRAARPSASYARSLAVLARAKAAGLVTKSGLMLGMGETAAETRGALADLRGVGVDIVTLGQYLRPSAAHLPVARWWHPQEFDDLRAAALAMGFAHVEASPLTRSSYHAGTAATAVLPAPPAPAPAPA